MQIFIKNQDHKLWEIISKGNFVPSIEEGDKTVQKPISTFTHEKTEKVVKNYKALNILFRDLNSNKFNHMFACDTTKEVWETLQTTYEGTSQVQESKS